MTGQRVKRLKDLVDLLERLPASPDRDRLLSEVRSRAVDVDTGVTPRAMRSLRKPPPTLVLRRPRERDSQASITRTSPAPSAPAVELARPTSAAGNWKNRDESLVAGELLSLEDPFELTPRPPAPARGDRAIPSWTLGLRA